MLKIYCDYCGESQDKMCWLVFSPPTKSGRAKKFHICQDCCEDYFFFHDLKTQN